eukprot:COSAG02_NODE_26914_length_621_cov_0.973180_1_plen_148_part_10
MQAALIGGTLVMLTAAAAQPALLQPGTYFSGTITDRTVLQRGDQTRAGVYGMVVGAQEGTVVTVTVSDKGIGDYTVRAEAVSRNGTQLSWHALLHPHPASGGNVSVSAACANCANDTASTITDLTYGDVWFCAGEPNAHSLWNFLASL